MEFGVVLYMFTCLRDDIPENPIHVVSSLPQMLCCLAELGASNHTSTLVAGFPSARPPTVALVGSEKMQ